MKTPFKKLNSKTFDLFLEPLNKIIAKITPLTSAGDRPLKMTFEDQLKILTYYHLEEHDSGRHLIQALQIDEFASSTIAPDGGIQKSSFFEAINSRGLEQLIEVFDALKTQAQAILPNAYPKLGELIAIDGSYIDGVLSMDWAKYRSNVNKAKAHIGFNVNTGTPYQAFITEGSSNEVPFVAQILKPGQTAVTDRGYQCHKTFDLLQEQKKSFICRIREKTEATVLEENALPENSIVFYDSIVLLGRKNYAQTKHQLRLVAYRVDDTDYWIATNRFDLSSEQIAQAYKLRWETEIFFGWWKRHLSVYHILARSEYGLKVQIFAGLITFLLLAIFCHEQHGEKVSIKRVRELRYQIRNESRQGETKRTTTTKPKKQRQNVAAKT